MVSPTYASYIPAIHLAGAVPRFVPLNEDANFDLDPDAIAAAAGRRTRALILCNPNNPTGTVFSAEQTRRMLEVAEREDVVVIADEVYKDFLYGDARIHSAAMRDLGAPPRAAGVLVLEGLRDDGLARRFLHGPAALVADMLKVHDALVTCAPVVSQYAALAALELGDEVHRRVPCRVPPPPRSGDRAARRLPHVFDYQKPNASYFVFPRVKDTVPLARDSRRLAPTSWRAHGRAGAGRRLRAHRRGAPAAVLRAAGRRRERAFDRLDDYFAGRPARITAVPAAAGVCSGGARHHPSRRRGAAAARCAQRTWRAPARASSPSRGARARR